MARKFVLEVEVDPDHEFLHVNLDGNVIAGHWAASLPLMLERLEQRVVRSLQPTDTSSGR